MRELFIAGFKLYGVTRLFSGISDCIALIPLWQSGPAGFMNTWLISAAVSFLIVYASVAHAEKIADLFGLKTGASARVEGFSVKAALKVGLILIGVTQFLHVLPALIKELFTAADPIVYGSSQSLVAALIQVIIPIALVFATDHVIRVIERKS